MNFQTLCSVTGYALWLACAVALALRWVGLIGP